MSDPRLSWLLDEHLLTCPTCGSSDAMSDTDDTLECGACNSTVPIVSGVPDFFTGYADDGSEASPVDPVVVAEITSILDLPSEPAVQKSIETALRLADRDTDSPALTAEIKEVHARFVGGDIADPPLPTDANTSVKAAIERHYPPPPLVPGERCFVNVRFRNVGDQAWSSRTSPVAVTAASRFHRRSFGRRTETDPVFTPLPIDIEPGRAITLPIEVVVPNKTGDHQLELGLFHHPDGFVADAGLRIDVTVSANGPSGGLPANVERREGIADYGEDHRIANEMVDAALDRIWPEQDRRIIEIGGSTHPQSWNHDRSELVNLDISAPTLQLGALYDRHHDRSIVHLCADAMHPPLTPGSWHAVTMYATLHHFPEPERLLDTAARLLRPGGFVAIMCEPTGTTLAHPAGVRDLLGGINEQTFSVDEYIWMADQAGLTVEQAFDDGGSFKAILWHG